MTSAIVHPQGPSSPPGASNPVVAVITSVATSVGLDPRLAVAVAIQESGLNPTAVGDGGTSFGLYQLHQGGELGTLTPQQAFDPATNALRALSTMASVANAHPGWTPGQIAAAAQRPADRTSYAQSVDQIYARLPSDLSTLPGGSLSGTQSQPAQTTSASSSTTGGLVHLAETAAGVALVVLGGWMLIRDLRGQPMPRIRPQLRDPRPAAQRRQEAQPLSAARLRRLDRRLTPKSPADKTERVLALRRGKPVQPNTYDSDGNPF